MKEIKNAYVDAEVIDFESTLTTDGSLNMYIDGMISRTKKDQVSINLVALVRSSLESALKRHATWYPQSLLKHRYSEKASCPTSHIASNEGPANS